MKKLILILLCFALCFSFSPITAYANENGEITAPSAVLMEAESGRVLYEKNPHEIRACASITKVMTLLLVMEAIDEGKISLTDQVAASAYAASMGGSDIWLKEGEVMSVDDLLKATVIMSANDAAVVLAEYVSGSVSEFVDRMNERAKELNMQDTVFKNPNGLDEDGHVTSAYDVALMSRELIKHEKIKDYTLTWIDNLRGGETQLVNTNKLIKSYSGITGLKTGTTGKAGSCITATAERNGLSLISVVLGCATTDDRFKDAASLLDRGFAGYAAALPSMPQLPQLAVLRGMEKQTALTTDSPGSLIVEKGKEKEIVSEIILPESIEAPFEKGCPVGVVRYKIGEEVLKECDIFTKDQVEEMTFRSVFQFLMGILAGF